MGTSLTWPEPPSDFFPWGSLRITSTWAALVPWLEWRQPSLRRFKRSLSRNVYVLSTTLHTAFSNAFNWMVDIRSMHLRASLDILVLFLRRNSCKSWNNILSPFNKCNFYKSIICGLWFYLFQKLWNRQNII